MRGEVFLGLRSKMCSGSCMCPAARIQQEGVCYCTDLLTTDWTTQILAKHVFALLSNEPQKSTCDRGIEPFRIHVISNRRALALHAFPSLLPSHTSSKVTQSLPVWFFFLNKRTVPLTPFPKGFIYKGAEDCCLFSYRRRKAGFV